MLGAKNIQAVAVAALWDAHVDEEKLIATGADIFFHNVNDLENWLQKKLVAVHQ